MTLFTLIANKKFSKKDFIDKLLFEDTNIKLKYKITDILSIDALLLSLSALICYNRIFGFMEYTVRS
jgi:hypothetical protein